MPDRAMNDKPLNLPFLTDLVCRTVRSAGDILMQGFGGSHGWIATQEDRAHGNLASRWDRLSEEAIVGCLLAECREALSDEPVALISEEAKAPRIATPASGKTGFHVHETDDLSGWTGYTWAVDPLCGSINYMRGLPDFAVSAALLKGTEIILGAVLDPVRGELFHAAEGRGAFLNGEPIRPSTVSRLDESYVTLEDRILREIAPDELARLVRSVFRVRIAGSCGKEMCYVAAGRTDALVKIHQPLYDYAAGAVILREALRGAAGLTALDGSGALAPSLSFMRDAGFLATNGLLHEALSAFTSRWRLSAE